MRGRLIGTVLVAFAASTLFAGQSERRSGGGRAGGSHPSGGGAAVRSSGGSHSGGRVSVGHSSVGNGPGKRLTGAESRHPVAGTGHGSRYYYGGGYYGGHYGTHGYGSGHYGSGHYGSGYYGRSYYGRGYPYYGSHRYYPSYRPYGYYPYGGYWGSGLGIGLYYGSGYAYPAPYYPSYYGSYPASSYYAYDPQPEDVDPGYVRREDDRQLGKGELRLDVRPDDASVYLDDQFLGPARQLETLSLPPGPHRIEVVRPGFRTVERVVQVRPDASVTAVVELERQ